MTRPRLGGCGRVSFQITFKESASGAGLGGQVGLRGGLFAWDPGNGLGVDGQGRSQVLDLQVQVRVERRACGDQVAEDDVLLQADQRVDRAGQGGFGENLGGLLEAGGGDEAIRSAATPW